MTTMHSIPFRQSQKTSAAEALKSVLHQVSAIKLKSIDFDSTGPDGNIDLLAQVDVYGHRHTLACKFIEDGEMQHDWQSIANFRDHAARMAEATPVLIARRLSPQARSLCHEHKTGFVDLDGNARLEIGEVFIARQHVPLREEQASQRPSAAAGRAMHRKLPLRAEVLSPDRGVIVASA